MRRSSKKGRSESEEEIPVERSSGNVFEDLGLENAEELAFKATLAARIMEVIQERGWTQAKAAEVMGTKQPHVSAIFNARVDGVSVERLIRFLTALGQDVEVGFPPARETGVGRITTTVGARPIAAKTA